MSGAPGVVAIALTALVAACQFDGAGLATGADAAERRAEDAAPDAASGEGTPPVDAAPRPDAFVVTCSGPRCACEGADSCASTCAEDDCTMRCEHVGTCASRCGDDCEQTCADTATCDLACGDDCAATCTRAGSCTISCGADCAADCRDAGACVIVMDQGAARCDRAGQCVVRCRVPGQGLVPAVADGDGVYRCAGDAD